MKNKGFVIGAIVVVALGLIGLKLMNSSGHPTTPAKAVVDLSASLVGTNSPTFGNSLGRVTVVEWFDPECESCRMIHPVVKKIIADYKDRVQFVLRYMPYHQNSMFVATALEEARELGKFEEALDVIFEKQPEWGDHHQPRPDLVPGYLIALGIPKANLDPETLAKKHSAKVRADEADGNRVGVNGTPTFFVNGQMLNELGERPLREAIEAALKTAN